MAKLDYSLISTSPIIPDHGAGWIDFGVTGDEVQRRIGYPTRRFCIAPKSEKVPYGPVVAFGYGASLLVYLNGGYQVFQIAIGKDYTGKTGDGVGIGTPLVDAIALWGDAGIVENQGQRTYWRCQKYSHTLLFLAKDAHNIYRVSGMVIADPRAPRPVEDLFPRGEIETRKRGMRKYLGHGHDQESDEPIW
jgi:hypothetical protein